jgi:TldD protein
MSKLVVPSRRGFLRAAGAGVAALSMPGFVAGCAKSPEMAAAADPAAAPPPNPFSEWFGIDESVIRQVMAELSSRGADFADLYFQHSRFHSLSMEDGIISKAYSEIDQGVGLRVVVGDQVGYAFTEDLTLESMLGAARTAAAIAQGQAVVPPQQFTYADAGDRYLIATPWSSVGVDAKLPLVQKVADLTKGLDPAVDKVSVAYTDYDERVIVASLDGKVVVDSRPMTRLFINVIAKKGDEVQSNGSNIAAREGIDWYTDERLATVAKEAVDRTMILFEAVRPKAGEMPVVLAAGASGILLHEAIGHGMEADFNRKGTSIYSDMIGKNVAADFVTIVDDGTQANQRGALNVDDEGTPAGKTNLVENGVLKTYLHDQISARHYGLAPTGSGRRESFRHVVMPRMRSTYMENGPHTRDEIVASVKNGIIAETYTNGQVAIGAGDFTFYIKNGWLIEDGKVTAPIKDVNIIGNGPESLQRITMVADDMKLDTGGWTCGKDGQSVPVSQGMPTVLVSKMTVGGADA